MNDRERDTNEFTNNFTPPDFRTPTDAPADQVFGGHVNIQIMVGPPAIKLGSVALVLHNMPISPVTMPDGTQALVPCVQLTARQAMEVAMNMIHIAKMAETQLAQEQKEG